MQLLRLGLRPLTWIALVAMLGMSLMPAVSHALAWAGGSGDWAEVCSADGLKRVAADGAPAGPGGLPAAAGTGHCPFCLPGTPAAGMPPAPLQSGLAPAALVAGSPAGRQPPVPAAAWAAAQPRGPPAGP
jgi:hypothetical protein